MDNFRRKTLVDPSRLIQCKSLVDPSSFSVKIWTRLSMVDCLRGTVRQSAVDGGSVWICWVNEYLWWIQGRLIMSVTKDFDEELVTITVQYLESYLLANVCPKISPIMGSQTVWSVVVKSHMNKGQKVIPIRVLCTRENYAENSEFAQNDG